MHGTDRAQAADLTINAAPAGLIVPDAEPKPSTDNKAEYGSGWYHDVAIQEAQQTPARPN